MIRPFICYIAAQLPDLVIGHTIHLGDFPLDAPNTCSFVAERVNGRRHKYNNRRSVKRFQIVTRAADKITAHNEANRIFDAVVNLRAASLAPYAESGEAQYVVLITEGNEPAYFARDEKSRYLFSSNITLRVRKEN